MSKFTITGKHAAFAAVAVCVASVLALSGINVWLMLLLAGAFGLVWSIGSVIVEMTVQEIQGRRKLRKAPPQVKATGNGSSFEFISSYCTMPIPSSVPDMLTSCGAPSVSGAHHCARHLVTGGES